MNPTGPEVAQFAKGGRDESLAVISMAKRTGLDVFEVRWALREAVETSRKLQAVLEVRP